MARKLNAETISHVKRWEGFRAEAYPDPGSSNGLLDKAGFAGEPNPLPSSIGGRHGQTQLAAQPFGCAGE